MESLGPADATGSKLRREARRDARAPLRLLGDGDAGFKLGMMTLDRVRPTVGASACGMAGRALHSAVAQAKARHRCGPALAMLGHTLAWPDPYRSVERYTPRFEFHFGGDL